MITSHFFVGSLGITISPSTNRYFDEINFHGQCERHAPRINPADIVVTLTRGRLVWISSLHLATFMDSPDLGAIFFPQHLFFGLESDRKLGIKLNPIGTPWLFNNLRKPWPMKKDDYIIRCLFMMIYLLKHGGFPAKRSRNNRGLWGLHDPLQPSFHQCMYVCVYTHIIIHTHG